MIRHSTEIFVIFETELHKNPIVLLSPIVARSLLLLFFCCRCYYFVVVVVFSTRRFVKNERDGQFICPRSISLRLPPPPKKKQNKTNFCLFVSGQTVVDVMLHLIVKFKKGAFLSRWNRESLVGAVGGFHQLRCNGRLKLLFRYNGIEIALVHPSALLVKLMLPY